MNYVSSALTRMSDRNEVSEMRRLLPIASNTAAPCATTCGATAPGKHRIFEVDARFESAGTWSGVEQLIERAYLDLLDQGKQEIVDEHLLELYMVLLKYRDRIHPKYLSLTETATAEERTRFYALDRAYRLVHGLVGMVLQWRRSGPDRSRWIIIVRNFDHAQHLGRRFFVELARRAAATDEIEVVIETRSDWNGTVDRLPGILAVPAAQSIADLRLDPPAPPRMAEVDRETFGQLAAETTDIQFEQIYPTLLADRREADDGLAAARIAIRIFIIYNGHGYYHEARTFVDAILPYFEPLVENDEAKRMHYVSKLNFCLVMTGDATRGLRLVGELAASYLTKPYVLAGMNYILGMHYLRYAEAKDKDVERAERHILLAVDNIHAARDSAESRSYPFKKVFIDNGLAFLRARQGRHQEALELCKSGYDFLTREMGEDRHRLHRSVLQYNIAQVYVMLGRLEDGLEYYRNAISMDPNYSEYYNEAGNILQELGNFNEAIEYYAQAIASCAPYPEVYFNKGVCHARQEELDAALTCFEMSSRTRA